MNAPLQFASLAAGAHPVSRTAAGLDRASARELHLFISLLLNTRAMPCSVFYTYFRFGPTLRISAHLVAVVVPADRIMHKVFKILTVPRHIRTSVRLACES